MADLSWFDGENTPDASFDPLPAGDYLVVASESELKRNSADTGNYLKFKFDVVDGEYAGRTLFLNLNIEHPNETAQKIARSELKMLCRAVGNMAPRDSSELHSIPIIATVKHEKRKDNGELQHRIAGFKSRAEAAKSNVTAATAGPKAPWKRAAV